MSSNNNNASPTPIVCFDVGGTVYKVSRSLLELYPYTMLARMASEEWQPKDVDGEANHEPLFIDRDAERFRYCLDYMRDAGVVSLPFTVSREAFLNDLSYYGFVVVDPNAISVTGAANALHASYDYFTFLCKERETIAVSTLHTAKAAYEAALQAARSVYRIQMLAVFCAERFRHDGNLRVFISGCLQNDDPLIGSLCGKMIQDLYTTAKGLPTGSDAMDSGEFVTSLAAFGLKPKEINAEKEKKYCFASHVEIYTQIGVTIVLQLI